MHKNINIKPYINFDTDSILMIGNDEKSTAFKVNIQSVIFYDSDAVKVHAKDSKFNSVNYIMTFRVGYYPGKLDATGETCSLYSNFSDFVHRDMMYFSTESHSQYSYLSFDKECEKIAEIRKTLHVDCTLSSEYNTFRYMIDNKSFTIDKVPVHVYIQITKDKIEYGTDVVIDSTGISLTNIEPDGYGEVVFDNEKDAINKLESIFDK